MANETPTSSIELIGLQGQLDGVRSELIGTNNNLQGIANLIRSDSAQDQQRLLDERREQQILSESQIREGQEAELEQKISASFTEPANELQKNLSSTFDNIGKSLKFLFTGIVGQVFIRSLTAAVNLGRIALSGVGNLISGIFGAITTGLGVIRNGFGSVINSISGIVGSISRNITALAKSPFKAIADAFKKLLGRGASRVAPAAPAATAAAEAGTATGIGGKIARLFGPVARMFSGVSAVTSAMGGDLLGAGIYGSAALFPGPITGSAALAYTFKDQIMQGIDTVSPGFLESLKNSLSFLQPDQSNSQQVRSTASNSTAEPSASSLSSAIAAELPSTSSSPSIKATPLDQSQIEPLPSEQRNLNPPAESTPEIVYLRSGGEGSSIVSGGNNEYITDVPLIPSANPDNFYTLYSQLNYNVVI
jgi:hypothetical protein